MKLKDNVYYTIPTIAKHSKFSYSKLLTYIDRPEFNRFRKKRDYHPYVYTYCNANYILSEIEKLSTGARKVKVKKDEKEEENRTENT